ncbi:MAG: NADPH:quinone reductase [Nitriliruptoraceae bacterium]
MRAVVYDRTGAAADVLRLVEVPDPAPGPGQVRVRIEWSGVNPSDVKRRVSGVGLPEDGHRIPHQDGGGVIDQVGDGVDAARIGERVWIHHAAKDDPFGTAAEYTCVAEHRAMALPDGVSTRTGAGLGVPYMTAYHALFDRGGVLGRTVLVTGGAGACGLAAVQLGRHAGGRVIATVSTEAKADVARRGGAHHVLRYTAEDHRDHLAAAVPYGIDHVVDVALASNIGTYADLLSPGATVVAYAREDEDPVLPMRLLTVRNVDVRFMMVYQLQAHQHRAAVRGIASALEEGVAGPLEFVEYDLEDVVAAHEMVEQGAEGKVVVRVA